ncbi:MarR family transcriptional regulator [Kitasatospora sp. RB6PN24]|uniref:MarR family winged helix-turn-helix transcriptional regulator n=1 Tax=Kitasatospora humi TaxID=2893891 RepID=UPI001E314926|nr:MarR family transcriptional regulator [Kitasatospora humi]MCC9311476.1 MarR family transcriptional regulator [Kitasatospora humi]
MNDDAHRATAVRVYQRMAHLVLESDDRRREVVEATGLSFARTKALRRLARGPMRMTELAAELLVDKPYATVIVDELERRGLVVRSTAPDDRRAKVVTVTDQGRELARLANEILARPPQALIALPAAEMAELDALLAKLTPSADAVS